MQASIFSSGNNKSIFFTVFVNIHKEMNIFNLLTDLIYDFNDFNDNDFSYPTSTLENKKVWT